MEKEQVKKIKERKTKTISIRTFPSYCKFMNEEKLSPTSIFNLAVKELMEEWKRITLNGYSLVGGIMLL